jgi:hypothetical protein
VSPTRPDAASWAATKAAAALSLLAAALHAALVEDHLQEWWGYGLFFIAASIAQGVYGLVMFAMPARPPWAQERWRTWRRRLYMAGIVGNLSILALYVVTRTVGIPFFGPEAGEVEAVGAIDVVTKLAEVALVGCLAFLHRGASRTMPAKRSPA